MTRLENIDEFLSVIHEFEENNEDRSVIAFLTDLALVADIDLSDQQAEQKKIEDYVSLMTLHSAKRTRISNCLSCWNGRRYFSSSTFLTE